MCEPVTASFALASVFGGVVSAVGQHIDLQREASSLELNRQLARIAAGETRIVGARAAGEARLAGSEVIGEQRVLQGGSGVDMSYGTPADIQTTTRVLSELDAHTIMGNASREAWGLEIQAIQYGEAARAARIRSYTQPFGTLLGSAGQVGGILAGAM